MRRPSVPFLMFILAVVTSLTVSILAQTGGTFDLSHNVTATGGGSSTGSSDGRTYRVDGTVGQNSAGTRSSGTNGPGQQFVVRGGFWAFEQLVPTAALVSVSGRVTTSAGKPIAGAQISLTNVSGSVLTSNTDPFGLFRIDDVEVGQTYFARAVIKGHQFVSQAVSVEDAIADLNFVALPEGRPRRR